MGRSIPIPISISKLMDQRINSLCTLDSYSNLVLVVIIIWYTTIVHSLLMTKIMIVGAVLTVLEV